MALINIAQEALQFGQNGFLYWQGSGSWTAGKPSQTIYWISTISASNIAAQSRDGSNVVAAAVAGVYSTGSAMTVVIPVGFNLYGPFSAVSMSAGNAILYKAGF